MFKELLEELSLVKIALNGSIEEDGDSTINTKIFGKNFGGNVLIYKKNYFRKLRLKERKLLIIQEKVYATIELTQQEKTILLEEIEYKYTKLQFLREIYNTEAQKIDPSIQVSDKNDIDFYNKIFFGVTQKDIGKNFNISQCNIYENVYKKSDIKKLILYSQMLCPELEFKFGKFNNFSHNNGVLKIPNQKYYNIQNIITLFFHETTHFFRTFNGERNLGFKYQFSGYSELEEGIAIYNEYLYGNKIMNYGKFIPYYNACLNILLQKTSEEEKQEAIYQILKCKGFNKERSLQYYNRFYKYCSFGNNQLFLKDLIYYNGYKNVTKLLHKNSENYKKIMAGDIGIRELKQGIITPENNFNYELYFRKMTKKIKALI